jgi:hypothetical protein
MSASLPSTARPSPELMCSRHPRVGASHGGTGVPIKPRRTLARWGASGAATRVWEGHTRRCPFLTASARPRTLNRRVELVPDAARLARRDIALLARHLRRIGALFAWRRLSRPRLPPGVCRARCVGSPVPGRSDRLALAPAALPRLSLGEILPAAAGGVVPDDAADREPAASPRRIRRPDARRARGAASASIASGLALR